jgi:hypothetical protein
LPGTANGGRIGLGLFGLVFYAPAMNRPCSPECIPDFMLYKDEVLVCRSCMHSVDARADLSSYQSRAAHNYPIATLTALEAMAAYFLADNNACLLLYLKCAVHCWRCSLTSSIRIAFDQGNRFEK